MTSNHGCEASRLYIYTRIGKTREREAGASKSASLSDAAAMFIDARHCNELFTSAGDALYSNFVHVDARVYTYIYALDGCVLRLF